jgi:FixJ family two-component response regulator
MESRGSVLLVDDEETFRESTGRLLRREGFECQCARDGDDAVRALQSRRFDVMVADIRMPGNPDLRIVHAAKELDSQMPVVLVTGYPSTETAVRAIDLSVAAYMTKPPDFDKLLGHVKTAIDSSGNRRAAAAVRERLQTCLADLETAESQSRSRADGNDELISIGTIRTLAACLSELLRLGARSGVDWGTHNLCVLLDCPQQPIHRQAIVAAVEVLKKTKDTFKSKALAELRTKLEDLLGPREGFCRQGQSCARIARTLSS